MYIHIYLHKCICVYICVCTYTYMYIYIYINIHIYIYVYIYIHTHEYMDVLVYVLKCYTYITCITYVHTNQIYSSLELYDGRNKLDPGCQHREVEEEREIECGGGEGGAERAESTRECTEKFAFCMLIGNSCFPPRSISISTLAIHHLRTSPFVSLASTQSFAVFVCRSVCCPLWR